MGYFNETDELSQSFIRLLEEAEKQGLSTQLSTAPDITAPSGDVRRLLPGGVNIEKRTQQISTQAPAEAPESEFNLATAVGKGLWSGLSTATVGISDWLLPGVGEWARPESSAEEWFTTIGMIAGFASPMKLGRLVTGAGVKSFSTYGSKKMAKTFTDDAVAVLKKDTEFVAMAKKKGADVDALARSMVQPVVDDVTRLGTKKGLTMMPGRTGRDITSNLKLRKEFTENLLTNTRKIVEQTALDKGYNITVKSLNRIDEAVGSLLGSTARTGWKTGVFPMTTLQERLAYMLGGGRRGSGGGKIAQLAATSLEEAILFSAAELPMNFMYNMTYNPKISNVSEWLGSDEPGKALQHAFTLGTMLGLVRHIPWGGEKGIFLAGLGRATKHMKNRRKYSKYDPSVREHRQLLEIEAQRVLGNRADLGKTLSNVSRDRGIENTVTAGGLKKMFTGTEKQATAGAAQVKKWLMDIEKAFYREWWPDFMKGAMKDVLQSAPRMLAGSLAFNYTSLFGPHASLESMDNKWFHLGLGAVLTRKHHPLRYHSSTVNDGKGGWVESRLNRPYLYGDYFQRVDKYLEIMGTAPPSNIIIDLFHKIESLRMGIKTPLDHPDMMSLVGTIEKPGLLRKMGLIVEGATEIGVKENALQYDEVYNSLVTNIEIKGLINLAEERMLQTSEISVEKLNEVLSGLSNLELKTLKENSLTKKGQDANVNGGINAISDIETLFLGADSESTKRLMEIEEKFYLEAYDSIVDRHTGEKQSRMSDRREDTDMLVLRELLLKADDHTGMDYYRIQEFARLQERYDGVLWTIDRSRRNRIVLTRDDLLDIVGLEEDGVGGRKGPYDKAIHEYLTEKDPHYDESFDQYSIVGVGHPYVENHMNKSVMIDSIDKAYKMLMSMDSNELGLWKLSNDKTISNLRAVIPGKHAHSGRSAEELISSLFVSVEGQILNSIEVRSESGKILGEDNPEVVFAKALHSVLKRNPIYLQRDAKTEGTEGQIVDIREVRDLHKLFNANGVFIFDKKPGMAGALEFMQEYVMDRAVAGFLKRDGTKLTSGDREQIRILFDNKLITPTFEMKPIVAVLDAMTEMIVGGDGGGRWVDTFVRSLTQPGAKKMMDHLQQLVDRNVITQEHLNQVKSSAENLAKTFGIKVPEGSTSNDAVELVLNDLLSRYGKIVKKFIVSPDGKTGFLKPTGHRGRIVATPEILLDLVASMEALEHESIVRTHNELLADIRRADYTHRSSAQKDFLRTVESALLGAGLKGNVPRAVQILINNTLWNPKQKRFEFLGTEKDIKRRMKDVTKEIQWETQIVPSELVVRNAAAQSMDDMSPVFKSERSVIPTIQKYVDKYRLKYDATPGRTLTEVFADDITSLETLSSFSDKVKSDAILDKNGVSRRYDDWSLEEKDDFLRSTSHLYNSIKQRRKASRIIVVGKDSFYKDEVISENGVYTFLSEELGLGEIAFIDATLRDVQGYTDTRTIAEARERIINIVAETEASYKYSFDDESMGLIDHDIVLQPKPGYITIVLGSQSSYYGIPLNKVNTVVNKFARWARRQQREHGGDESLKPVLDLFEKKISDLTTETMVDLKHVVDNLGEGGYIELPDIGNVRIDRIRHTEDGNVRDIRVEDSNLDMHVLEPSQFKGLITERSLLPTSILKKSEHLQFMITMMYGDHSLVGGREWLSHVVETMNSSSVDSGIKVAKLMRRIGLDANSSALRMTPEYMLEVAGATRKDQRLQSRIALAQVMERIANEGYRAHIIDETDAPMFSTSEQLRASVNAESSVEGRDQKLWDYWDKGGDIDVEGRMKGGRADDSTVNSVVYISRDMLNVLKALIGISNGANVENIKPILWNNQMLIGKTMFTASHDWHDYLSGNKLDMVLFGTATKRLGESYRNSSINQRVMSDQGIGTIEALRGKVDWNELHRISIPAESVKILSTVAVEHDAAIPYQIGTEIISPNASRQFYDWLFDEGVERFDEMSGRFFSNNDPIQTTAWAQRLLFDVESPDYAMTTAAHHWIKSGGHPFAHWLMPTIRSDFKRRFIDEGGLIVPRSKMGGQSALIPSEYLPGHPLYLRNAIFTNISRADGGVDRVQVTYGQVSLPDVIASRGFDKSRLQVIEYYPGRRDKLVRWDESRHGSLEGLTTIGQVHEVLQSNAVSYKGENDWKIEAVSSRQPSKSISDKVVVGIKDFDMTGNAARINAADLLYRLEGDFDVDKINYWWDTPGAVLSEWNNNSPKIASVEPGRYAAGAGSREGQLIEEREKNSVKGLDWTKPQSQWKYLENTANAKIQMGKEVNMRRLIQYLKYYNGYFEQDIYSQGPQKGKGGFSIKIGKRGRLVLNWKDMDNIEATLSRDIQEIIDSTTGYDLHTHGPKAEWEDRILFGDGTSEYPGIVKFETKDKVTSLWEGTTSNLQQQELSKALVRTFLRPYQNILRLSSNIYDFGQEKRVRYDDMVDYVSEYARYSKNFSRYVYGKLLRQGFDKNALDGVFMVNNRFHDVFSFSGSLQAKNFETMLPYDRVMFSLGSRDRLQARPPVQVKGGMESMAKFETFYEDYFMGGQEEAALTKIVEVLTNDIGALGSMNRIQRRIDRLEGIKKSASRRNNISTAKDVQDDINRHEDALSAINERLITSPETAEKMNKLVQKQIEKQVVLSGFFNGQRITWDGKKPVKRNERRKWVDKNRAFIGRHLWDKENQGRSAIRFKTISDNDYLSSMIMHRILKNIVPIVDKSTFPTLGVLHSFESTAQSFKQRYRGAYIELFAGKRRGGLKEFNDLDRIGNLFLTELHNHVNKYESIMPGLGKVFLFKTMIPEADPLAYTWFNGRISEGFSDTSPIFVKLGMRYLATHPIDGKVIIEDMGKQFSAHYEAFHGNYDQIKLEEVSGQIGRGLPVDDFAMINLESRALMGSPHQFVLDLRSPKDRTAKAESYSSELKSSFGIDDVYTIDYLTHYMSAPERAVLSLRDAINTQYRPEFADGYDGDFTRIYTHDARWDRRFERINLYLGDSLAKRIIKMKFIPGVGKKYGGGENRTNSATREDLHKQANRHNEGCNPLR